MKQFINCVRTQIHNLDGLMLVIYDADECTYIHVQVMCLPTWHRAVNERKEYMQETQPAQQTSTRIAHNQDLETTLF